MTRLIKPTTERTDPETGRSPEAGSDLLALPESITWSQRAGTFSREILPSVAVFHCGRSAREISTTFYTWFQVCSCLRDPAGNASAGNWSPAAYLGNFDRDPAGYALVQ
jgi:hypothetical protein